MKPTSCHKEMVDTERLLFPGAPQDLAQYQSSEKEQDDFRKQVLSTGRAGMGPVMGRVLKMTGCPLRK